MLPRLYPIIDRTTLEERGVTVNDFAQELAAAGVGIVQYRDKLGAPQQVLQAAAEISAAFTGSECIFVMNDRADLAALVGWGVHVGQGDLPPQDAKRILFDGLVGVSTHGDKQVLRCTQDDSFKGADYIAIGPVFATLTKADAEPVVGLEGVRRARALTSKPLVAIGGITRENARSVIDAGADSVAVISAIFQPGRTVRESVEDFLERLR